MPKFFRTVLELVGIAVILFVFGNDGIVESSYNSWWTSLSAETRLQFPQSYRYLPQYTLLLIFVLAFLLIYRWLGDFGGARRPHMPLDIPDFYAEISKFYELYFNDRVHELKK